MTDRDQGHGHLDVLDGLRGFAAYIVIVSHVSNISGLWHGLLGGGAGQIGVMIFFVLSGYLMGILYFDKPFCVANARTFAVRRFARVIPLFYFTVSVAMLAVFASIFSGNDAYNLYSVELNDFPFMYGVIYGTSLFWTVPVEIHFYILFTGLWALHQKFNRAFWLLAAAILIWYFLFRSHVPYSPYVLNFIAYFVSGLIISKAANRIVLPSRIWSAAFVCAIAALFLLFPQVFASIRGHGRWANLMQMWHDPVFLVAASALLMTCLRAPVAKFVFANRFMVFSGRISYSLYLLHLPIVTGLWELTSLNRQPLLFASLVLLITIGTAACSYRYLELPMRAFINKTAGGQAKRTENPLAA